MRIKKKFLFPIAYTVVLVFLLFLPMRVTQATSASPATSPQPAASSPSPATSGSGSNPSYDQSECVVTKVGNASGQATLPASCTTNNGSNPGGGVPPGNFVYYCQGDPKWAGECDLGGSGCGVASSAMIISTLSQVLTPDVVAHKFEELHARACGTDISRIDPEFIRSSWFTNDLKLAASENVVELLTNPQGHDLLKQAFKNGALVIASSDSYPCICSNPDDSSKWYPAGHVVVIQDIDVNNGTVAIRDPSNCHYSDGTEGTQNINRKITDIPWSWAFSISKQ